MPKVPRLTDIAFYLLRSEDEGQRSQLPAKNNNNIAAFRAQAHRMVDYIATYYETLAREGQIIDRSEVKLSWDDGPEGFCVLPSARCRWPRWYLCLIRLRHKRH